MKSRFFLSFILLVLLPVLSNGQSRHMMLRDADTAYKNNMYQEAESNYRKARELDKDVQATFNLGNASYNQGKFEEAAKYFDEAGNLSTDAQIRSNAFFNKGNSMHQAGDLAGALESYKESLKLNPNDAEARDNYLSTLKKLRVQEQQQQEQQQQQQQQEENQEQEQQEQENQQSQQNQEQQNQEQQENQEQQNNQTKENEKEQTQAAQSEENKDKLNKEEVDRLLEMIQREEERMQEKMKGKKSTKKIIKDW